MKRESEKFKNAQTKYGNAVKRFEEILQEPFSDIVRDSAIKRFELTFDLSWKAVKDYIELEGVPCSSPKSCFREAFRLGIITYDDFWLEIVDMRNEATHSYDESYADKIYKTLPKTLEYFSLLQIQLKAKVEELAQSKLV